MSAKDPTRSAVQVRSTPLRKNHMRVHRLAIINYPYQSPEDANFTCDTIGVLSATPQRAIEFRLFGTVPPVVLLWSILGWRRILALVVLRTCSTRRPKRQDILQRLGQCRKSSEPGLDCSLICNVLESALQEASSLGHAYVASEHLLLALLRTSDPVVCELFAHWGVTYELYRRKLLETLRALENGRDPGSI